MWPLEVEREGGISGVWENGPIILHNNQSGVVGLIIRLVLEWPLVQENTVGTGLYSMYGRGHWRWTSTPEEDGVLGGICRSVASPLVEYNTLAP